MKREDLLRLLREAGCNLVRHGGNHDWYENPGPSRQTSIGVSCFAAASVTDEEDHVGIIVLTN